MPVCDHHVGGSQVTVSVLLWDALLTKQRKASFFYAEFSKQRLDVVKEHIITAALQAAAISQDPRGPLPSESLPDLVVAPKDEPDWLYMDGAGREAWAAKVVTAAIIRIVGAPVGRDEPLMSAGVDSLGMLRPLVEQQEFPALR